MRRLLLILAVVLAAGVGCGRGASVHERLRGAVERLARPVSVVVLVPFTHAGAAVVGPHPEGAVGRWFPRVARGAREALAEVPAVRFVSGADDTPTGAVIVRGEYLLVREVSALDRAWLGTGRPPTRVRARVRVERDGALVYAFTVDGTYLAGAASWGYETPAAQQALGAGLGRTLTALIQEGAP